jgi:hypothetical protein
VLLFIGRLFRRALAILAARSVLAFAAFALGSDGNYFAFGALATFTARSVLAFATFALRGDGNYLAFGALATFTARSVLAFATFALRGDGDYLAFGALATFAARALGDGGFAFAAGAQGGYGFARCGFHTAAVLATALARTVVAWANASFHTAGPVDTARSAISCRRLRQGRKHVGQTFRPVETRGSSDRSDRCDQGYQSDTTIELLHCHFPFGLESKTFVHFQLLKSVAR